jgi:hypothetical protein
VDIRREIDGALETAGVDLLEVVNVVADGDPFPDAGDGTLLRRGGRWLHFTTATAAATGVRLAGSDEPTLVTGLDVAAVTSLIAATPSIPHVLGHHGGIGYWMLTGERFAAWSTERPRATRVLPIA